MVDVLKIYQYLYEIGGCLDVISVWIRFVLYTELVCIKFGINSDNPVFIRSVRN